MNKNVKKSLIVLLASAASLLSFAENPDNNSCTLKEKKNYSDKKRVPSIRFIQCEAINEMLVLDTNFDYVYMEVEISGPESLSDMLTPLQPFIEAPSLSGIYTIRCTTDGGAVYEGTITL